MPDEKEFIYQKLQEVQNNFSAQTFKEYLDFLARFPSYSPEQSLLIFAQKPDASQLMSFQKWKQNGRHVRAGEKGIAVFLPVKLSSRIRHAVLDEHGEMKEQMVQKEIITFRRSYMYDISQTEGRELPEKEPDTVKNESYDQIMRRIKMAADPMRICIEPVRFEEAGGYCDYQENKIVIDDGLSQSQTIATALYGLVHTSLRAAGARENDLNMTWKTEVKAMTYLLCRELNIDVPEMKFPNAEKRICQMNQDEFWEMMKRITRIADRLADEIKAVPAQEKKYERRLTLQEQLDLFDKISIDKNFPSEREEIKERI